MVALTLMVRSKWDKWAFQWNCVGVTSTPKAAQVELRDLFCSGLCVSRTSKAQNLFSCCMGVGGDGQRVESHPVVKTIKEGWAEGCSSPTLCALEKACTPGRGGNWQ